jgi:hypothetical protein
MPSLIRIGRKKAFLRRGEWFCADRELERRLNHETEAWIRETGGPSMNDPDPERRVAEEMSARFSASLSLHLPSKDSRSVYLARRQMRLAFSEELVPDQ